MDLELGQIALLLDEGNLHGEQLAERTARVDFIKWQKGCITDLLCQCAVEAGNKLAGS